MKAIDPEYEKKASADPVALDQASYDMVKKALGKDVFFELHKIDSTHQMAYAEKLGLGSCDYDIVELI